MNGLGILRNLAREGITCYCVLWRRDPVIYSRYCREYFVIPDLVQRPDLVRSFLSDFHRHTSVRPVLFSVNDRITLALSDLKDQMRGQYAFVVPDKKVAETLIFKSKFYESLSQNGIEHPRVIIPCNRGDYSKVPAELGYPVFVKPDMSYDFSRVFSRKGFTANSEVELRDYCKLAESYGLDMIVQEIIPGPATNTYGIAGCLDTESHPLALFGYHRLRGWPLMFGNSSLMESFPLRKLSLLTDMTTHYLANLGYYGIMDVEFKRDPRNGAYKLIEINARSWWQNSLPTRCGLNVVLRAYLDAIGEKIPYSEDYTAGVKWINFLTDIQASIASDQAMKASWVNSVMGVRDFAFFDWHDAAPAISSVLSDLGIIGPEQGRTTRRVAVEFLRRIVVEHSSTSRISNST
jgi:predicted ATP-grasp superfamily ATP-dependent carboligase